LQSKYIVGEECRLQTLTETMIGKPSEFPALTCKSAQSRHLVKPMLALLRDIGATNEKAGHRIQAYELMCEMITIVWGQGIYLTEASALRLRDACDEYLLHYNALVVLSRENNGYNFTTKIHFMWRRRMGQCHVRGYVLLKVIARINNCVKSLSACTIPILYAIAIRRFRKAHLLLCVVVVAEGVVVLPIRGFRGQGAEVRIGVRAGDTYALDRKKGDCQCVDGDAFRTSTGKVTGHNMYWLPFRIIVGCFKRVCVTTRRVPCMYNLLCVDRCINVHLAPFGVHGLPCDGLT
jgi:hypothetical protein